MIFTCYFVCVILGLLHKILYHKVTTVNNKTEVVLVERCQSYYFSPSPTSPPSPPNMFQEDVFYVKVDVFPLFLLSHPFPSLYTSHLNIPISSHALIRLPSTVTTEHLIQFPTVQEIYYSVFRLHYFRCGIAKFLRDLYIHIYVQIQLYIFSVNIDDLRKVGAV